MGAFGDKFRKARESKDLSFDDVSNVIKITPRMLRAIEEENFDQLPGGVFNKGFIRSYAKHLGLDPEEAVGEYLEKMRQAQIEAQQAWQPPTMAEGRTPGAKQPAAAKSAGSKRSTAAAASPQVPVEAEELPELHLPRADHVRPKKREFLDRSSPEIPWKIVAVGVVVVVLATVLWVRHSHRRSQGLTPAPASPAVATQPAASQISSAAAPETVIPNLSGAQSAAAPTPDTAADNEKNDVTVHNFGKPLTKSVENPSGALMLTLRASENSWISVVADGQPLTEETLIAPAHPTFRASRSFIVKLGNAAAVTFLWNGQELPAQGGEGEVKTLAFDSNGMRVIPPSQPAPAAQSAPNQ
jgi:cytoskeleton protein RodZ